MNQSRFSTNPQDQGFAPQEEEHHNIVILNKESQEIMHTRSSSCTKQTSTGRYKEPRLKLTFISKNHRGTSSNFKPLHDALTKQRKDSHIKSLQLKKKNDKSIIFEPQKVIEDCAIKINRNYVAENLPFINHDANQVAKIKHQIISIGAKISYEVRRQNSTFAHLGMLRDTLKSSKLLNSDGFLKKKESFLDAQLNRLLNSKIKESFIHPRSKVYVNNEEITFESSFQSANLQMVAKISGQEYHLYLRNDTNTHGHQNWFYFRVKNNSREKKCIRFKIVNLKRNLPLLQAGQKIFYRSLTSDVDAWTPGGQNITIELNKKSSLYRGTTRTLSFNLNLQGKTQYQISSLPPYTYSQMLEDLQQLRKYDHVQIQTLTYSLVGLAIPLLTFTLPENNPKNKEKQVILISARIHPGQTVASYMVKGIIQSLKNIEEPIIKSLLSKTVIKIIPMINPDGVVFGNFRTNFLGYDLNRSFHSDDEITNPQIVGLKNLGRNLKTKYGSNFTTFIDMHGHSSQKNIFTYGPDFQSGNENFYKARLFPKLLSSKSPYFKYNSCTFKLEQYKVNTARGFFLNTLNVMAYTIESSYAIFEDNQGKNHLLTENQWINFGKKLGQAFQLMKKLSHSYQIKNRTQLRKALDRSQQQSNISLLKNLKKQIKRQASRRKKLVKSPSIIEKNRQEDSDGQDEIQDLDVSQRQQVEKKLQQNSSKNVILPKVFKPSILYPTVTPKIYNLGQQNLTSYKVLYTRRNRYHSIKLNANTYLQNFQGYQLLKPPVSRNIQLQKKYQY